MLASDSEAIFLTCLERFARHIDRRGRQCPPTSQPPRSALARLGYQLSSGAAIAASSGFDALPDIAEQFHMTKNAIDRSMCAHAASEIIGAQMRRVQAPVDDPGPGPGRGPGPGPGRGRGRGPGRGPGRGRGGSRATRGDGGGDGGRAGPAYTLMECVYTTVDPTAKVFMRPELESRVETFVDNLALDVRQAARYASERYCTLFALDKVLSAGAVQNALESGLHRCLQDDAINYAAVLHVAKLVGITLVVRCGSPGSPCIVFPCRDGTASISSSSSDATSPDTSASCAPAILITREVVISDVACADVRFRFDLEAREASLGCGAAYPSSIGHSLDHVRSHLARCDEVHRMYRELRRPLQRNSVTELMPVVLALALVSAGGGDIVPCAIGGVTKETATYHAALARRMGGKSKVIGAVEAALG